MYGPYQEYIGFFNNGSLAYQVKISEDQKINLRIVAIKNNIDSITNEKEKAFAELLSYLLTRRQTTYFFSFNSRAVDRRSIFIEKVTKALIKNDPVEMKGILAEKEIIGFKGYFTQHLYDLMCKFRKNEFNIEPPAPRRWFGCFG
jgi:hypothetical protein